MSYTQDAKPNWPATLQVSVVLTAKGRTAAATYIPNNQIYTVSQKKTRHQILAHNFPKC